MGARCCACIVCLEDDERAEQPAEQADLEQSLSQDDDHRAEQPAEQGDWEQELGQDDDQSRYGSATE